MKQLKIALAILYEIETAVLAVKDIRKKTGVIVEVCPRAAEDSANSSRLDEFIRFAQSEHAFDLFGNVALATMLARELNQKFFGVQLESVYVYR